MTWLDYLVLALFPPLFLFALIAAWVFWADYIIPAWNEGSLSLREHKLPISIGFIVLGLSGETLFYGISRYIPDAYSRMGQMMPIVGFFKCCYLIGVMFAVAWAIKMRTQKSYLGTVFLAGLGLWLLSLVLVILFK